MDYLINETHIPTKPVNFRTFPLKFQQTLPKPSGRADLRSSTFPPVFDQGRYSSCVENALANAISYLFFKIHNVRQKPSRFFMYFTTRVFEQRTDKRAAYVADKDTGSWPICAVNAANKYGWSDEGVWPYDAAHFKTAPGARCYAKNHRLYVSEIPMANAQKLVDGESDVVYRMKLALDRSCPVMIAVKLWASFFAVKSDGKVPLPDAGAEKYAGLHALLVVGYADSSKAFVVQNSWGTRWGDKGYATVPYRYVVLHGMDIQVIENVAPLEKLSLTSLPNVAKPFIMTVENLKIDKRDGIKYAPPPSILPAVIRPVASNKAVSFFVTYETSDAFVFVPVNLLVSSNGLDVLLDVRVPYNAVLRVAYNDNKIVTFTNAYSNNKVLNNCTVVNKIELKTIGTDQPKFDQTKAQALL